MVDAQAKARFLKKISNALGRVTLPTTVVHPGCGQAAQEARLERLSQESLINVFARGCAERGADLRPALASQVCAVVAEAIASFGGGRVMYPQVEEIATYGLEKLAAIDGVSFVPWDLARPPADNITLAEAAQIGLTFPLRGIADTGTVIQHSDAKQARSISLLPIAHISILRQSDLRMTMTETMLELRQNISDNDLRHVVHISGPSTTGDIENVIVTGVHGPVHECVVLVTDC